MQARHEAEIRMCISIVFSHFRFKDFRGIDLDS